MRRRCLNAYYDKDGLVFVSRGGDGTVRLRRVRAESSCFVHRDDMTRKLYRMMRGSWMVRSVKAEGDWHRVVWIDRGTGRSACRALEAKGIPTAEGSVSPLRRYLADHDVEVARPRRVYLDLETDSRVPFSKKESMRIFCWALVDDDGPLTEGVLEEDSTKDERRLLKELWDALEPFDQVIAWSGDRFDFPVLRARTRRARLNVDPRRWLWLDHLELFKRLNKAAAESGDEKQSMALQAIAMQVLGEGKDDLDASKSREIWEAGGAERERLVRYCVKDTDLMRRIEEKTGFIDVLQAICEVCGVFPDSRGANPGAQVETFLLKAARSRGYHFPTHFPDEAGGKQFRGAFVMEPTRRGICRDVHVADFSSLYPSVILSWNISPETKAAPDRALQAWAMRPPYLKNQPMPEVTRPANVCEAATGQRFRTDEPGLLAVAVGEMMKLRDEWSERKSKAIPGTPEWKDADRRSAAFKIGTLSFYGVFGSPLSSLFDKEVAESVTQCGVYLITETIKAAEARGMKVIYGDTDSIFVANCTRDEFETFVRWCNAQLYPGLLRGCGCKDNRVELAYEKEFERIVFVCAKRYAGRYLHFKGKMATVDSKPEVKGLEYKRGDSTRLARRLQEDVVNQLLAGDEDPTDFEPTIEEHKRRILEDELPPEDVLVSKTLTRKIKQYKRTKKKDGTWARQQPHVEIARILEERGRDVGEGARIKFYCHDGDGSPKGYRPAEDYDGDADRHELWDSQTWPPTFRVLDAAFPAHPWQRHDRTRPRKGVVLSETLTGEVVERRVKRGRRAPEGNLALPWGVVPEVTGLPSAETAPISDEERKPDERRNDPQPVRRRAGAAEAQAAADPEEEGGSTAR